MSEFKSVTKEICKLPSFFSTSLFRKIDNGTGVVTRFVFFFVTQFLYFYVPWVVVLGFNWLDT